jgi:hypothetical protein
MAATFSAVMRRYSAGEHAPRAISEMRRQIVSPDAAVSRAIVRERADEACAARFRMRLFLKTPGAESHTGSSDNHGGGQHQHPGWRHVLDRALHWSPDPSAAIVPVTPIDSHGRGHGQPIHVGHPDARCPAPV